MAFNFGYTGNVTSWGSGDDVAFLTGTAAGAMAFSANIATDAHDVTAFASTPPVAIENIPGLKAITGSMRFRFKKSAPDIGRGGLVTFSAGGYTAGAYRYALTLNWPEGDVTSFNATPPSWKSFLPGLLSWSAVINARIDTATALALPHGAGDTIPTVTFKVSEEGATDNTIAGTAMIESVDIGEISPQNIAEVTYNLTSTSALAFAGASNLFASATTLGIPDYTGGNLDLRTTTGRTLAGSAFLTQLGLPVGVAEPIAVTANWRGTGAWALGT